MRKFKASARKAGSLIGVGLHTAIVTSAIETKSKQGTEQLEITVQNAAGVTRNIWLNLTGFRANKKGEYIDANGKMIKWSLQDSPEVISKALARRIEDPAKTETCLRIVQEFACDCGIPDGDDFEVSDLVGSTVLVGVMDDGKGQKVSHTFHVNKATTAEAIMSKKLGVTVTLDEELPELAEIWSENPCIM